MLLKIINKNFHETLKKERTENIGQKKKTKTNLVTFSTKNETMQFQNV